MRRGHQRLATKRGRLVKSSGVESSQPGGRRDAVADHPCSQTMEIGNGEERLRAEPWISFMIGGQDGGFGGHQNWRIYASVRRGHQRLAMEIERG